MKKTLRAVVACILAVSMCLIPVNISKADSASVKPFIAFGADLSAREKKEVLKQFDLTEDELADYETIQVTNADEHEYLSAKAGEEKTEVISF